MIMFFRRIFVLAGGMLGKKATDIDEESVISFRVWPGDLEFWWMIVLIYIPLMFTLIIKPSRAAEMWKKRPSMNFERYFQLMAMGRQYHEIRGGAVRISLRTGWRSVIGGVSMKLMRPLLLFQKFEVRARQVWWDAKRLYCEVRIERNGEVMAVGITKTVVRDSRGTVPTAEVFKAFGLEDQAPPSPDPGVENLIAALR